MTDPTTHPRSTEPGAEPVPMRMCLASYLVVEARHLVAVAAAEAEADRSFHGGGGVLTELDAIASDLARAEARLHRLLTPRSP